MYLDLVKKGAEAIRPVYEKSGGKYGFLSGQVDPRFVRDGDKMLAQGLQIAAQGAERDGQAAGLEGRLRGARGADRARHQHQQHHQLHRAAVHALHGGGHRRAATAPRRRASTCRKWRSVITHMSARLGELSDWKTEAKARGIELTLPEIRDGEEAVLKRAYHYGKSVGHPSKMLQCSMRVEKDERTGKTVSRHIQDFAGSDMVYTCPPGYIAGLMTATGLEPFDPNAIDREPNKASIEKLMKLPSFRQAYEFDGMRPAEFAHFGASRRPRPSSPRRRGRRSISCG